MSTPAANIESDRPAVREQPIKLRRMRPSERRTPEQILEHYLIEKELAARLMNAGRSERAKLYSALYDELFARVPHHAQLQRKISPAEQDTRVQYQVRLLRPWINRNTTFLEIGAGDCSLSFAVAPNVTFAYAVDVSETVTRSASTPQNFKLLLSDGTNIPVASGRITLAYSNQLMEHLHPDDALEQLREIYRSLASGGTYVCVTPNRLTGPHDISQYFDDVATGFHLKEYTSCELIDIFRRAGFRTAQQCFLTKRGPVLMPNAFTSLCESICEAMPHNMRSRRGTPLAKLLELRIVATK